MELTALAIFGAALFVNASTPGPSIAALVARVLSRGAASVMPFLLAMWIGEAVWLSAAVFGLGLVAERFYEAFVVLKFAGVAYLLWLAWKMWHAPADVPEGALPAKGSSLALFGSGLAITLGNPKLMAFYLAILPTIVDIATISTGGWGALVLVMLAVLILVDLAWVLAASRARRLLRSPRAVLMANRTGAVAMGGAAVVIAAR